MLFWLADTTSLNNDSTTLIVWAVCVGVSLGYIFNFLSKAVIGPFIRALLEKGATEEGKAVTLGDMGFSNKKLLKLALRNGSSLRSIVSVVGGQLPEISNGKKTVYDFEKAKLYIVPEKKVKAEITYGKSEKWYLLILFIAIAVGIGFGMSTVMPILMEALF